MARERAYARSVRGAVFQPFPMLTRRRAQAWHHQTSFRRPRHFHAEPELNLVVRGCAALGVGDDVVRLRAGDVILFQPGQDHVLLEASADLDLFVAALRPELAERGGVLLARAASSACSLDARRLGLIASELEGLAHVADATAVERHLVELFDEITPRLSINHVLSRRVLEEVRLEPELAGEVIAQRVGVDPSALSRHFHGDFKVTFVEYRARMRVIAFVRLVDSGWSLTAAAGEAGFGSYAQCHRVVSRALGCSPQRYFAGARARVDDARFRE